MSFKAGADVLKTITCCVLFLVLVAWAEQYHESWAQNTDRASLQATGKAEAVESRMDLVTVVFYQLTVLSHQRSPKGLFLDTLYAQKKKQTKGFLS